MSQPAPYQSGAIAPAEKTNVMAIVALVTGILSMAIVAVICGHISLNQIKKTGEGGRIMAIIGLVLGYLGILVWVIIAIAGGAIFAAAANSGY